MSNDKIAKYYEQQIVNIQTEMLAQIKHLGVITDALNRVMTNQNNLNTRIAALETRQDPRHHNPESDKAEEEETHG